jgi:hypothetical protein
VGVGIGSGGDPNLGWSDPIGTFMRLQWAVRSLASGEGPRKAQMDEATSALTGLAPAHFPAAMRKTAERVLSVRDPHDTRRAPSTLP